MASIFARLSRRLRRGAQGRAHRRAEPLGAPSVVVPAASAAAALPAAAVPDTGPARPVAAPAGEVPPAGGVRLGGASRTMQATANAEADEPPSRSAPVPGAGIDAAHAIRAPRQPEPSRARPEPEPAPAAEAEPEPELPVADTRPGVTTPPPPVPEAIRAVWPAYFEDANRADAPFLWALPRADADLSPFLDCLVPGPEGPTWAGRLKPPIAHFRALEPEFGNRARIGHLLACVIVILRREPQNRRARRLFRSITANHGPEAARAMNLRWLTAVCDSFVDTGAEPLDRALGMSGTLLSNTLKLAETERRMFYPSRRWPPQAAFRRVGHMYDGVIGYWVGQGDMIENLVDRLEGTLQVDSPAAPFLRELVDRCFAENTVLRRMLLVQDGRSYPLVPDDRQAAIRKAMEGL